MPHSNKTRRCAIYTRKSSEEGLDQEFNSLDAQREAGEAFIKSQAHEGWKLVRRHYDDGGFSGGNMERPALAGLMADIEAGQVETVVVYKVDRLTRSLRDFARLIDLFDRKGVSFVAVTQQFNTTTSMGRLMLNVLLSFAQFEREVTGERIRDKITASKKRGMWMGGVPPLGYEAKERKLVVVPGEAGLVRKVYALYLKLGSVTGVTNRLHDERIRTRRYTSRAGRTTGGRPFSRGHVQRILTNAIYAGYIAHAGERYEGDHEAIVDAKTWNETQEQLTGRRTNAGAEARTEFTALLRGRLFDDAGNTMSPVRQRRHGRCYSYYVSQALIRGRAGEAGSVRRVRADEIEKLVVGAIRDHAATDRRFADAVRIKSPANASDAELLEPVSRIVVSDRLVQVNFAEAGTEQGAVLPLGIEYQHVEAHGGTKIISVGADREHGAGLDPSLIKAVARANEWRRQLFEGEVASVADIATKENLQRTYVGRILPLAFLAPDITRAIVDGRQPTSMTIDRLREPVPMDWNEQRSMFGFPTR